MVYKLRIMRKHTQTRIINRNRGVLCISCKKNIEINDFYVSNDKNRLFHKKIYCPECAKILNII